MATRSRYCLFMAKEKLRIIEEAEYTGIRAAGRQYGYAVTSEMC